MCCRARPSPSASNEGESYATAKPIENLDAGRHLFLSACAACHTIGQGEALGPDLQGVTERRDRDWLRRYIKAPDAMRAQKDPVAMELFTRYSQVPMPNLRLGDDDVEALIRYLEQQGVAPAGQPSAPHLRRRPGPTEGRHGQLFHPRFLGAGQATPGSGPARFYYFGTASPLSTSNTQSSSAGL